jgi:signal transduction histidine kinase
MDLSQLQASLPPTIRGGFWHVDLGGIFYRTNCLSTYQLPLINTVKHAAMKQASIRLTCEQGILQIVMHDESGLDLAASQGPPPTGTVNVLSSKIGLLTIRERMKALNGRFDLALAPKQGTTATLTVPIGPRTTSILSA